MVVVVFFMQKNLFLAGIFVSLILMSYKHAVFTGLHPSLQIHPGSFLPSTFSSGARHNVRGSQALCSKQKLADLKNEATSQLTVILVISASITSVTRWNFRFFC